MILASDIPASPQVVTNPRAQRMPADRFGVEPGPLDVPLDD
jgi:hypothetical protein